MLYVLCWGFMLINVTSLLSNQLNRDEAESRRKSFAVRIAAQDESTRSRRHENMLGFL